MLSITFPFALLSVVLQCVVLPSVVAPEKLVMSELVEYLSLSNPLDLCSHHFPARLCQPGGINKDHIVGIDGDGPPLVYVFKNNKSLTKLKF
jgi:hypothetical protein